MNNKTLLDNLRCIPDFPIKGINFRDVTTLFKSPECLQIMVDELYEIYKDKGITNAQEYFETQVKALNEKMPPYKAVKRVKLRESEFKKNTSRKITRFNIDKSID